MDEFSNQLIEAPEDDNIDELNDETFGESTELYEEWEPHHDEYATIGLGEGNEDNFDFEFGLQETDLVNKISQLVVEDDDDISPTENGTRRQKKPSISLDELFGPNSPPGLFDAEELAMGHLNIWGSPARDRFLHGLVSGAVNRNSSSASGSSSVQDFLQSLMKHPQGFDQSAFSSQEKPKLLDGARTLEEIENDLMNSAPAPSLGQPPKRVLTVEELERQLRGDDVGSSPASSGPANIPQQTAVNIPMAMPRPAVPELLAGQGLKMPTSHLLGSAAVPIPLPIPLANRAVTSGPGNLQWMPPAAGSPSGFAWPPGVPLPPRLMSGQMLHQRMMSPRDINMRYPLSIPRLGVQQGFMVGQRYIRPGTVDPSAMYRSRHPGLPTDPAYVNLLRSSMAGPPPIPYPNMPPRIVMPHKAAFPLQRQQIFQQQMMWRHMASARFSGNIHNMMPYTARGPNEPNDNEADNADEYNGLMTQREKDWVTKIQLLQLHTDNPYVDDYYFTCWSLKKMLRERQQREGIQNKENESEPTLVLPQLAKAEMKTYAPAQFEGALGRLTASSIHNPRQIINISLATGHELDEPRGIIEVKRFKEVLLRIEKGYDSLLEIEDVEKKALAQPPESRQLLYNDRKQLISQLYQRLKCPSTESGTSSKQRTVEADSDGLQQIVGIRKGLLLVLRLMPLLESAYSRNVVSLLLQKLATKKDWHSELLTPVYKAIAQVVQSSDLPALISFASTLTSNVVVDAGTVVPPTTDKNAINRIVTALQCKLGISAILCMFNRAEVIYSSDLLLDVEVDHQNHWCSFIEVVSSAFDLCDKLALVQPIEFFPLAKAHLRRALDKRWILTIEEKFESVTVAAIAAPT